jgi:hypothetical protein
VDAIESQQGEAILYIDCCNTGDAMNAHIPLLLLTAAAVVSGCATEPVDMTPAPPLVADTNVYFYPTEGHTISRDQQGRDKYECNSWAVQQTGFDPSQPQVPPHQRMQIIAAGGPPPGAMVGGGALTGAVVGSAVSRPWESGRGALFGALAGAAIGGIAEAERNEQVSHLQAQANLGESQAQNAALEQKATAFRRALGACLGARGYRVR